MTPAEINNKLKILNGNITRQTKIDDNFQKLMHHTNIDCMISNAIARLLINSKNNVGAACFLNNDTNVLFSANNLVDEQLFDRKKIEHLNFFLNDTDPEKKFSELIADKLEKLKAESEKFCKNFIDKLKKNMQQNEIILKQIGNFYQKIDDLFKLNYLSDEFCKNINELIKTLQSLNIDDRPFVENILKIFCKLDSILFDFYLLSFSKKNKNIAQTQSIQVQVCKNDEKVHCEINLAFKLLKENIKNWNFIGVSKLCCPLCRKTLECLIGQSKKDIYYSGSHNCYMTSKYDYRLPVESEIYPGFLECFNSWIENATRPNEIHKVNQICECNQDPKEAYLIPCEIIGFNETFDIHYFKLDQLNSEQEYFLDKFPKVIQLIERFNVIKTFHNLLFNNQMDTNT